MKPYFIRGSVLALTLGVAGMGSLYSQNVQTSNTDSQQTQSNEQDNMQQPEAKAFTGVIVKDGSRFVLQDPNSKVSYKVDDDSKVKDYVGKQVKITGTLDPSANVIHVDSIEIVS
jgi:hypothetical protein